VIWQNSGSSIILDIKCSANFATYQHHSWLQILGYAALARVNNVAVQYIGLIMPLQRVINLVDIGQWDSSLYLAILLQEADTAASIGSSSTVNFVGILESVLGNLLELPVAPPRHLNIPISLNIGHHIHKPKVLAQGFIEYSQKFPNCPTQIFLRSRTGAFGQKTIGQIPAARDFIVQQPLKIYIHAPYTINLCANVSTPEGDFWQQRILNEDLAMANGMGSMGVIVHTGATCNRPLDQALNTMEFMVRTALAYATPGCPLLLETPVGEGTEVCSDLASFAQFCNRFTMEERDRLGICVDSCHVFAAGVDPLVYLQQWEHYCNIRIGLVHFNDSLGPKGSHVDRHASIGKGYIGETQMMEVATWCAQRDISMVVE
jgi:deoxyribonuclease-4